MKQGLSLQQVLTELPAYDVPAVERVYGAALAADRTKIIVLDDDPTGVQTVHDVFVYTDWKPNTLREAFEDGNKVSFLLTNSRGLTAAQTERVHREIASAIHQAAQSCKRAVAVISRSDSTLRGHYPLETETLRKAFEELGEQKFDGEILMPFFEEGGRYTIENVHYVASGDQLVPAGQTEFARDKTFGYQNSDLCRWVEEKTCGAFPAGEVQTVSLRELRTMDYTGIERKLCSLTGFGNCCIRRGKQEALYPD